MTRVARVLVLAASALAFATAARALDQVVTICANETDLRAKLEAIQAAGGGTLTFDCGTATIPLQNPLSITEPTTIDGEGAITLSGGGDRRIFLVAAGADAILQSLVLTDARGPIGGAILNEGDLTLRGTTIRLSEATQDGGAIASYGNVSILEGSVLADNEANGGGGAMFASGGFVSIGNSEVSSNTSDGTLDGTGGAIELLDGADLEIASGTITGNTAKIGGAVSAIGAGSTVSIDDSDVSLNHTIDGPGGAFHVSGGILTITDSTISANDAINGSGGGVFVTGATSASIRRSAIYGNSSTMNGGGVAIESSAGVVLENVTFGQNGALIGGGLDSSESNVSVEHATFAHNVATLTGASFSNSAVSGTLTIGNTILAAPFSGGNCSDDVTETTASLGGNLSSDASCTGLLTQPTDVHETDPMLAEELADNGGPTLTYLPQPGSPAIDTGIESGVLVDQRGFDRPQGEGFDRGAVEIVACDDLLCGDANDSGTITASDALAALRASVGSQTCALSRCDYDGSGEIQASDALAILRASVGQPGEPSCPDAFDCRDDVGAA